MKNTCSKLFIKVKSCCNSFNLLARGLLWVLQYPFKLRAYLVYIVNYKKVYERIIAKAKLESRVKGAGVYYEAHHIVPECLGGQGKTSQWKNHPNIVLLSGKEHFICHRLLCKIFPDNTKLAYALWAMCNQKRDYQIRYEVSSRAYEEARQIHSVIVSNRMKGHTLNKGKKQSEEHIKKRIKFGKDKIVTEQYKAKISEANSKPIKNIKTGIIYKSLTEAAKKLNCSVPNIGYHLSKGLYIYI